MPSPSGKIIIYIYNIKYCNIEIGKYNIYLNKNNDAIKIYLEIIEYNDEKNIVYDTNIYIFYILCLSYIINSNERKYFNRFKTHESFAETNYFLFIYNLYFTNSNEIVSYIQNNEYINIKNETNEINKLCIEKIIEKFI